MHFQMPARRKAGRNSGVYQSDEADISLSDIKSLIENTKYEILLTLKQETQRQRNLTDTILERVEALESKNKELELRCEHLTSKLQQISSINGGQQNALTTMPSQIFDELEQRNVRRLNIIVSGIPERTDGSLQERNNYDKVVWGNLLDELNLNGGNYNTARIGKIIQGRPRLLRVACPTLDVKISILRKSKDLRSSSRYRHVFVNHDLTVEQQKEAWKLREECRQRRSCGEDVVIYKNKVIQRNGPRYLSTEVLGNFQ